MNDAQSYENWMNERGAQEPPTTEEFVRSLLWDVYPECCGQPCVGAEYMGQQEMVCCGNFCADRLSDAQIVTALRQRFPETTDGVKGNTKGGE